MWGWRSMRDRRQLTQVSSSQFQLALITSSSRSQLTILASSKLQLVKVSTSQLQLALVRFSLGSSNKLLLPLVLRYLQLFLTLVISYLTMQLQLYLYLGLNSSRQLQLSLDISSYLLPGVSLGPGYPWQHVAPARPRLLLQGVQVTLGAAVVGRLEYEDLVLL